jgi:hypothetical protein
VPAELQRDAAVVERLLDREAVGAGGRPEPGW